MTSTEAAFADSENRQADVAGVGSRHQQGENRGPGSAMQPRRSELLTELGKTSIADSVVQKIAGSAAREIGGVHAMGTGTARAFGVIRDKLPVGSSSSPSQGVNVEVGARQAAVDLDVVIDYGVSIVDVTQAVREHVVDSIERMTALEVTEVNINVDDVWIAGDEDQQDPPRVQ
jgi:uncharacterized alkaline shock family protein YloU